MQLKGLVRFFTIVLILVSVYMLSFTWFVRGHENKLQARAKKLCPDIISAGKKGQATLKTILILSKMFTDARLKRLEDSTKDVTLSLTAFKVLSAIRKQRRVN
jgi:SecD/SecF fusion protein